MLLCLVYRLYPPCERAGILVQIRKVTPLDATAIARIITEVFEDSVHSETIQKLIEETDRTTFVADDNGLVVGFVDGFVTHSQTNVTRAELDLLAVLPRYRGQGIAKTLVQAFSQVYPKHLIRALVATNNASMHRIMLSLGYQQDFVVSGLYIANNLPPTTDPKIVSQGHTIPVQTFTYAGIWLEGDISSESIQESFGVANETGVDLVGVVCDRIDEDGIALLLESQFVHIRDFHWWTLEGRL